MIGSISTIFGILVALTSLIAGVGGAIAWYGASVRKQYAAERDFNHLKRQYESLAMNIEQLWRLMDEKFTESESRLNAGHDSILRELVEIKAKIIK